MSKTLFDTCVFWSCVTRCGCRTTSSTLFTVQNKVNYKCKTTEFAWLFIYLLSVKGIWILCYFRYFYILFRSNQIQLRRKCPILCLKDPARFSRIYWTGLGYKEERSKRPEPESVNFKGSQESISKPM
jgi:hypothetical protein